MTTPARYPDRPAHARYDVVIVGGAIHGSSTAWWLTRDPGFSGRVLVVERDPSYSACSTAHTNSCIRQQFSNEINIRISQFTAAFIKSLRDWMGGDERVPNLQIQNYGYMYLAADPALEQVLRENQALQVSLGAGTRLMTPDEILAEYPFYNLSDGIRLGSINTVDEGYWDGGTVFEWFRRKAREQGAEYIAGEVVGMTLNAAGTRVESVTLASGETVACGAVVNASGPRAARTAAMAGIALPVEPRKRFTWVFTCEEKLPRALPLTIDPSGVHMRQDGPDTFLCGCPPDDDRAVEFDDFALDPDIWLNKVWPVLANRVPAFERIKVVTEWAGHYAFNTLDQNAVVGPHPEVSNFLFQNGFSGHGLQQSPAVGRAVAERLVHGRYQSLDLSPFGYERIVEGRPFLEKAVI